MRVSGPKRLVDEVAAAAIESLASHARAGRAPAHLAPMSGAAMAALGIPRREALGLHLYLSLRSVISASVRLGVVGPHEAQRLQLRHGETLDAILRRAEERLVACPGHVSVGRVATVAPLLDVVGATHDRLYARLFQS